MRETLQNLSPWIKIIFWLSLFLMMVSASFFVAMGLSSAIWGLEYGDLNGFSDFLMNINQEKSMEVNKLTNLTNQLMGFLGCSLIFVWVFGRKSVNGFWLKKPIKTILIVPFLGLFVAPIIEIAMRFNNWLIPEGGVLETLFKPMEAQAEKLTEAMMVMETPSELWANILFIALVPAVCEEIAFRGVLQSLMAKGFKNVHMGIWMSAFVFSAIHFQFYGFIPRMLLGGIFGYLLIWTGSIWAPMVAHFVNNSMAVLASYYYQAHPELSDDYLEQASIEMVPLLFSLILFGGSMYLLYKYRVWEHIKDLYLHYSKPADKILGNHRLN